MSGCYVHLFLFFFLIFHNGSLLLLDSEKNVIKNVSKSKYLCQGYKPKIWVFSKEVTIAV